jgi:hypothetical protein
MIIYTPKVWNCEEATCAYLGVGEDIDALVLVIDTQLIHNF